MLESSAPSLPISDWQFDMGFDIPSTFILHRALAADSVFNNPQSSQGSRELILDLIDRASGRHGVERKDILHWIDDVALYSPGIIFAAGPMIRLDEEVHIVAVSTSDHMLKRMQEKIKDKPKGVWAYYLALADSGSGIISLNLHSIPLWLRGILSGEHIFATTGDDAYSLIKKLRIDSILKIGAASEIILPELAILDVYRKFAKRMPADSNLASLVLRSELESLGIRENELLAECDIALRARNVKNDYRKKAVKAIAAYLRIGPEELSKYHSGVVHLARANRKTPPPLPFGRIKMSAGKQIV